MFYNSRLKTRYCIRLDFLMTSILMMMSQHIWSHRTYDSLGFFFLYIYMWPPRTLPLIPVCLSVPSIHPFHMNTFSSTQGGRGRWSLSRQSQAKGGGYTLDESTVYHRATWERQTTFHAQFNSTDNLEFLTCRTRMSASLWTVGGSKYLGGTHTDTGTTYKPSTFSPFSFFFVQFKMPYNRCVFMHKALFYNIVLRSWLPVSN